VIVFRADSPGLLYAICSLILFGPLLCGHVSLYLELWTCTQTEVSWTGAYSSLGRERRAFYDWSTISFNGLTWLRRRWSHRPEPQKTVRYPSDILHAGRTNTAAEERRMSLVVLPGPNVSARAGTDQGLLTPAHPISFNTGPGAPGIRPSAALNRRFTRLEERDDLVIDRALGVRRSR